MAPLSATWAGPPLGAPMPHSSHVTGMLPCTAIGRPVRVAFTSNVTDFVSP